MSQEAVVSAGRLRVGGDRRRSASGIRPRGFTLIELLVVIAIIALLMSILMPALSRVKQQAQAVRCQAHLKQWGLVYAMYASDNNYKIKTTARDGYWLVATRPYFQTMVQNGQAERYEMYFCPVATKLFAEGAPLGRAAYNYSYDGVEYTASYGFNAWVYDPPEPGNYQDRPGESMWKTLNAQGAADVPVMTASYHGGGCPEPADQPPQVDGERWPGGHTNEMKRFALDRHDGFVNVLFMDWSTRKCGLKELWTLKWHKRYNTSGPWTTAGSVMPEDWPDWMRHFKDY